MTTMAIKKVIPNPTPLYNPTIRKLIDKWLGSSFMFCLPFGRQMEYIHGWLRGYPPHLLELGTPLSKSDAEVIVFAYFHDEQSLFRLENYG